jgi:hypothetical protein
MCLEKRAMFNLDINLFIFKNIIYIYAKKDEIYYWSLHDNEIIKKFVGHTDA